MLCKVTNTSLNAVAIIITVNKDTFTASASINKHRYSLNGLNI